MNFANCLSNLRRRYGVANSPARNAIGLRKTVDRDRAIAHPVQGRKSDVLLAVKENVLINLVGYCDGIPLSTKRRDDLQLLAAEYLSGWIVRGIDNDGLGAVIEGSRQLNRI